MSKKKNPIPVEDRAPSAAAAARVQDRVETFMQEVHGAAPPSDMGIGTEVEIAADVQVPSLSEHRVVTGRGRRGRIVGQAFTGGPDSRHAGKVCRGVQLDTGDLVTTPEENLRRAEGARLHSPGTSLTQAEWDSIFRNRKSNRRKDTQS